MARRSHRDHGRAGPRSLGGQEDPGRCGVVCSEIGRVEVLRAARRIGGRAVVEAAAVVADLDLIPLDRAVQDLAVEIGEPVLRTLDALHVASAVLLGSALTAMVTYDQRLADAAHTAGLPVVSPGR